MAYRRTYYIDDLSGPVRDDYIQIGHDLLGYETPDGWGELDLEQEEVVRCKKMAKALEINMRARRRGRQVANPPDPGYFAILCQFSDAIKEANIPHEMCPNNQGAMIRWHNPEDANKAEKILREEGFVFSVEDDG